MTTQTLLLLSVAVAFAAFVQGTTGVGFALITAPLLGLLAPDLVPVGVLALMLPLNLYVAWRERGAIDLRGAAWITVGRTVGTAGGVWVLAMLSPSALAIFVGGSILAAVLATLVLSPFAPTRHALLSAGVVTGITETATGVGGPPLALVYQHQPVPVMRATIAVCFLLGELVSLAVLAGTGHAGAREFGSAALLLPALLSGAIGSRFMHLRVNARFMRAFVLVFSSCSALLLLLKAS
ncbi:MAG: sulfite exporter TauE/SafE family protein [Rhizobacter sp.]|nr:sulfite exporter TauE/SafE family protein [Rhizobacter sp.]